MTSILCRTQLKFGIVNESTTPNRKASAAHREWEDRLVPLSNYPSAKHHRHQIGNILVRVVLIFIKFGLSSVGFTKMAENPQLGLSRNMTPHPIALDPIRPFLVYPIIIIPWSWSFRVPCPVRASVLLWHRLSGEFCWAHLGSICG